MAWLFVCVYWFRTTSIDVTTVSANELKNYLVNQD